MTNEEIIVMIRAEIERLMDEYKPIVGGVDELTGAHIVLAKLHSFLETLSEKRIIPNDLEEAADEGAKQYYIEGGYSPFPNIEINAYKSGFFDGAKWKDGKILTEKEVEQ